ncbi:MAG: phosphoribosyltransferase [Archaeoglobaceae archaeon]|nr:phosphoribosyltransferase [Archaeoglobaceae archaeon]
MEFKCRQYTWNDIVELCRKLSNEIRKNKFKPDAIVAIARGGWVPARILCDFLNVKDLYSVKTEHWGIVATETGKARITQPLNVDFSGKNVLIVDDVADTGETVEIVAEHVRDLNAKDVKIAVIDYKHTSKFKPDFFASEMKEWKWIVYPWSLREDLRDLIIKVGVRDVKKLKEILEREYEFFVDENLIEDVLNDEWYEWDKK